MRAKDVTTIAGILAREAMFATEQETERVDVVTGAFRAHIRYAHPEHLDLFDRAYTDGSGHAPPGAKPPRGDGPDLLAAFTDAAARAARKGR